MKHDDLAYKTITVNHEEKYVNVYLHKLPVPLFNVKEYDELEVIFYNLMSIGLKRDLKNQIFDGDIVELFMGNDELAAICIVRWNDVRLSWDLCVDKNDKRLFGNPPENKENWWRTNPNTINNIHIPVGYEIRTYVIDD